MFRKYLLFVLLIGAAFSYSTVRAQTPTLYDVSGTTESQSDEMTEELTEEEMCEETLNNLDQTILTYKENYSKHASLYQMFLIAYASVITRAEIYGYDTIVLNQNLGKLEQLIGKYSTNYNVFIQKLSQASKYICPETPNYQKNIYMPLVVALENVQQSAQDIRVFYQDTVREDILTIRKIVTNTQDELYGN